MFQPAHACLLHKLTYSYDNDIFITIHNIDTEDWIPVIMEKKKKKNPKKSNNSNGHGRTNMPTVL